MKEPFPSLSSINLLHQIKPGTVFLQMFVPLKPGDFPGRWGNALKIMTRLLKRAKVRTGKKIQEGEKRRTFNLDYQGREGCSP
jgi:hypothetical protein